MTTIFAARICDNMTLSQGDKLAIREIVREMMASPEIGLALEHIATEATAKATTTALKTHQATCPVKIKVDRVKWYALGLLTIGALVGVAFAPTAIKLLLVLLA